MRRGNALHSTLFGVLFALGACAPRDPETLGATDSLESLPKHIALGEPIILSHGFNASPGSARTYSDRVVAHLRALGAEVEVARLNPYASSEVRALDLLDAVRSAQIRTGAAKVHIIAHSQAGLDARYLASAGGLGESDSIRSITTISTPHHGTAIADFALNVVGTSGIRGQLGGWVRDLLASDLDANAQTTCSSGECDLRGALLELREKDFDARFNAVYPDAPGVAYQSVAGVSTKIYGAVDGRGCEVAPGEALSPESMERIAGGRPDAMTLSLTFGTDTVGHHAEEPNDGVVLVESARWGRFRGCLIGDHYAEVDQGKYASQVDPDNGFDVTTFYTRLLADLATLE